MLCLILIVGGLLIMMGQHDRSEALFYYLRVEDQVPENHLLRLIEKHVSFEFVRERVRHSYSETGRHSIVPELLLRIRTASPANANWWRNCACIWRGAGSPVWASIKRSPITPRFRKTGMDGFKSRNGSSSCSNRS